MPAATHEFPARSVGGSRVAEDAPDVVDNAGETTPLLGREHEHDPEVDAEQPSAASEPVDWRRLVVCALLYSLFFVVLELSSSLGSLPFKQILEDRICADLHGPSASTDCGDDEQVQSQLALLLAWFSAVSMIPGIITAIPYGYLADRFGNKIVMMLSCTGMALDLLWSRAICWWPSIFSVNWVWTAPLWTFIGGGGIVINALVFASISGLAPEPYRASAFSLVVAVSLGTRLSATILASELLRRHGPWFPTAMALCAAVISAGLPAVLPMAREAQASSSSYHPVNGEADDADEPYISADEASPGKPKETLAKRVREGLDRARAGAAFLLERRSSSMWKLVLALMLTSISWQCSSVAAQFARKKFGWSWSQIGYISVLNQVVSIITCLVILPVVTFIVVSKLSKPASAGDMAIARGCCFLFIVGAAIIVFAHSGWMMMIGLAIFDTATVYNMVLKSLMVVAAGESSALLFNCVGMVETASGLISGPLIAFSFKAGLSIGGFWVGLPLVIGAGFAALAFVLLCTVTIRAQP